MNDNESHQHGLAGTGITRRRIVIIAGLALVNHAVLDPILSIYRLSTNPAAYELNPLWRGALNNTPMLSLLAQIPLILLVVGGYSLLFGFINSADNPEARYITYGLYGGSIGLFIWGLLITGHHIWFLALRLV